MKTVSALGAAGADLHALGREPVILLLGGRFRPPGGERLGIILPREGRQGIAASDRLLDRYPLDWGATGPRRLLPVALRSEFLEEDALRSGKRCGPVVTAAGLDTKLHDQETEHLLHRDPPCRDMSLVQIEGAPRDGDRCRRLYVMATGVLLVRRES
ncbi:MAG: hypothetical protein HY721_06680 [Planctomycetes bacterium]|nr:hypothetical protein [Planctomycetota bacterium]